MMVVAVGIGAGLVAALLLAVAITGSPLGMLLPYLAPVPILIAALGWHHRAGLVATLVGALACTLVFRFQIGLAFVAMFGLPGWWLAYLALLGRPGPGGALEWYPVGRLLVWVAAVSAIMPLAGVLALGSGSLDGYSAALRPVAEELLRSRIPGAALDTHQLDSLVDAFVAAAPFLAAIGFTLAYALNLWLAAKAVAVSGRLPRPWPDLPGIAMPRLALALLAGAILAGFSPGLLGVAGLSLSGALVVAFALQGLALLHDRLRGQPLRVPLLAGTYLLIAFSQGFLLLVPMLFGLLDTAVRMPRSGSGGAGPQLPST